ncbi:hypothetical protein WA158_001368 [Blastocystis sp. Blastoise]
MSDKTPYEHTDNYYTYFYDEFFIRTTPLSRDNVMQYFMRSPFYAYSCLNQVAINEGKPLSEMTTMEGVIYNLQRCGSEPALFVIHKEYQSRSRANSTEMTTILLAIYFVVTGAVYQAPDLCSIVKYRLYNCMQKLYETYSELKSHVHFSPADGFTWKFYKQTIKEKENLPSSASRKRAIKDSESLHEELLTQIANIINVQHEYTKDDDLLKDMDEDIKEEIAQKMSLIEEYMQSQTLIPNLFNSIYPSSLFPTSESINPLNTDAFSTLFPIDSSSLSINTNEQMNTNSNDMNYSQNSSINPNLPMLDPNINFN